MSLKVQAAIDVTRSEPGSQIYASPTTVQKIPKIDPETGVDRLRKEEAPKGEPRDRPKDGLKKAEVESAVESINDAVEHINRSLRFSVHEDTQRIIVRVVNTRTDEVIKELPPEDVLDTVARIREMIGLLIDERA
ncbi:MAG TPA: flagellar protein FlaG [Limnochordia bacterium]|nr:flagellar protein FlaG [Limnochordia bacterium]